MRKPILSLREVIYSIKINIYEANYKNVNGGILKMVSQRRRDAIV